VPATHRMPRTSRRENGCSRVDVPATGHGERYS
jgi:hypothetical protein